MSQTPGSQTLLGYLEIFWGISKETRSSEEPGNSYSDSLEWQTSHWHALTDNPQALLFSTPATS